MHGWNYSTFQLSLSHLILSSIKKCVQEILAFSLHIKTKYKFLSKSSRAGSVIINHNAGYVRHCLFGVANWPRDLPRLCTSEEGWTRTHCEVYVNSSEGNFG